MNKSDFKFNGRELLSYIPKYSSLSDLRLQAQKRVPKFAFEYLDGGCNEDVNLFKNTEELREVELLPYYLNKIDESEPSLKTKLFGVEYNAPFGVAPIGLQGLVWPGAPEILARSALAHGVPFILSTVSTSSIETIGKISEGTAWFQLYHPVEESLTDDLLARAKSAGYKTLVILADVPNFGFRPRDIKNGLSMPPRMNMSNIGQMLVKPRWLYNTLRYGIPHFASLEKYLPKTLDLKKMGDFMNQTFSGVLDKEKVGRLRDKWGGSLVIKGVASEEDTKQAVRLGLDGVIVSNHGGRQLDAGESAVKSLQRITKKYGHKITVMMDSGVRSGPDIGRSLASGAEFVFLGRTFMYGVGALGEAGGFHTMALLKAQLLQLMTQLRCARVEDFSQHLK